MIINDSKIGSQKGNNFEKLNTSKEEKLLSETENKFDIDTSNPLSREQDFHNDVQDGNNTNLDSNYIFNDTISISVNQRKQQLSEQQIAMA